MGVIWDMPQQIAVRETEMPLTRSRVRSRSEYGLLQQSIDPATDADDTQKGPDTPRLNSVNAWLKDCSLRQQPRSKPNQAN